MNYGIKVKAFSRNMLQQFVAHQDRGGWRTRDTKDIRNYINEAQVMLDCLKRVVGEGDHAPGTVAQEQEAVIREQTADVANLMLIVAENCNCIQYTDEEMGSMG